MSFPVSGAVFSENAGHFESGPRHPELFPALWFGLRPELVERTVSTGNEFGRDLGVARRGIDAAVAEQHLNDPSVGAVFQKMRGEAVPQRMGGDAFGQTALFRGVAAGV